ncbi:hypothetical protein TWF696_002742 [Orbilia brochopaga]|uniref:Myb-like domain-containing protein n=1 Tax=Orbilia brochopaga TaxID=3140254 RepID=A0AAV9U2K8_9PEZI
MGGYIIARNSECPEVTPFVNPSRCGLERRLDNQFQPKEMRSSRCLVIEGTGEDLDETSCRATHNSSARIDEYPGYKHLFPHTIHHLLDDDSKVTESSLTSDLSTPDTILHSRHQQIHPPRLLVTGRADRINKSRRVSSSTNKDIPKTPGSPPRPELPKTPMSWSSEDDILLRDLKELRKLGWKEISAYFPKRTAHACQFRWRRLVSGTLKGHRQYPPQPAHTQPLSISADRRMSEANAFLQNFENTLPSKSNRTPSSFDMSPIDTDSKCLETSSPPSPSELLNSRCFQTRKSVSRSVSLSPLGRQQQFSQNVGTRDLGHVGWESDETHDMDYFKVKPISRSPDENRGLLPTDSAETCKSPSSQLLYLQDSDPTNYSTTSHRPVEAASWTSEEDSLLLNRRLSFDEVSILLHHRSEEAIWSRMGILRSSVPRSVRLGCASSVS